MFNIYFIKYIMVEFNIESTEDQGSTFYVNTSFLVNGKINRVKFQFSKKDLENDVWKEKLADRIEKEIEGAKTPLNINLAGKVDTKELKKAASKL